MYTKRFTGKKLTVGIFVDGDFIPSYSGSKNRMHYLARYLHKIGVKVVVFHCYWGWSDLKLISREPFKTYVLPADRYYNDLGLIARIIRKEGIHIIQFFDLESTISQGIKLSRDTGVHLISDLHYVVSRLAVNLGAPRERIQSIRRLEVVSGKAADHIIALTKKDGLELRKKMRVARSRISIVPSGIDLKEVVYRGPNFKAKTALFLGNLYFEPNAEAVRLIHKYILPRLSANGFKVLLVGDCPPDLKKNFKGPNFVFTGAVRNLDGAFRKTTVALAPVREGTGLRIKILNYLGAGLPVIATSNATSGIPKTKSIFIENNIKKYPDIIFNAIKHPDVLGRRARNGRKFIERHFDWWDIAYQTALVYKAIIAKPIKNKLGNSSLAEGLGVGKPDWLEEFERKGRFKKLRSSIHGHYSYGIIVPGKIKIIRQ